jgi:hypothetical protein
MVRSTLLLFLVALCIGCGQNTLATGLSASVAGSCTGGASSTLSQQGRLVFPFPGPSASSGSFNYVASPAPSANAQATLGAVACTSLVPKPTGINATVLASLTVATNSNVYLMISDLQVPAVGSATAPYGIEIFDGLTSTVPVEELHANSDGSIVSTVGTFGFSFVAGHTYFFEAVENADIDQLPPPPVPPTPNTSP